MSWRPEHHYPANPNARPPEGDFAGLCRFYAWEWVDRAGDLMPWGQGEGRYSGDCQGVAFAMLAHELDRLNAVKNGDAAALASYLEDEAAAMRSAAPPVPQECLDFARQRFLAVAGNLRAGLHLPDPEPEPESEAAHAEG